MQITIDDVQYYYKDEGKGPIILLIHGNPDSADLWDDAVSILKSSHRCIVPDLPGFGRSDISTDVTFNMDYAHTWLASFLSAIKINQPVHLIVHDIGAFYGLPWAIVHPEQIKSICVTNTLFFSDYKWHFWGRIWRTPLLGELTDYLITKWLYKINLKGTSPKLTEAYLDKSYKLLRANPKTQPTILKVYRAMSPHVFKDWENRYLELTESKPTMVFWGENDNYIPLKYRYAERFANGQEVNRITDAGHWAVAEEPTLFANTWIKWSSKMS